MPVSQNGNENIKNLTIGDLYQKRLYKREHTSPMKQGRE